MVRRQLHRGCGAGGLLSRGHDLAEYAAGDAEAGAAEVGSVEDGERCG